MGDRDVQAVLADVNSLPYDYKDGSKYTDYETIKNYAAGMDLGAITKASGALTTVGKLYGGSLQNLQTAAKMLGEAWQGSGADGALTNLKQLYVAAGTMQNTHTNLGSLLSQHVEMMQPFQEFFTKNLEDVGVARDPDPPAVFANMKNDFSNLSGSTNVKVPQGTMANVPAIEQKLRQQYYKANPQVRALPLDQPLAEASAGMGDNTVQALALTQARLQNSQNAIGTASQSVVDSFVAYPQKVSVTLPAPNVAAPPNPVVGPGNKRVPGPGSPKYSGPPSTGLPPGTALPKNGATSPGLNTPPGTIPPGTNPSQLPPGVPNPTDPSHLSSNPPGTTPPGTTPPGTTPPGLNPPGTTPPGTTPPGTTPPVLSPPGSIPPPSSTTPPNEKIPKFPNEKFPVVKPGGIGDTNLPSGSDPNLGTNSVGSTGVQDGTGNPSAAQEGSFAEEAAVGRTAAMSAAGMGSGMMPMAPMMGGMGGAGGQENERAAWMSEDEDVWDAEHGVPPVIG